MGAFGLGVVQGLATSTDEALKTHIKDNKDRFDKNLEAALSRNLERSTRYDKKSREAREALDLVAGLTGGDFGKASEVIKGIGGVGQAQGFVDKIRARQAVDKDFNFSDAVSYVEQQRGTLNPQQAIDQILTPYTFTTPPQAPRREGLAGLFDDPRSMAVQAKKEWLARGNTIREADNIIKRQGAEINYSKLATPEQLVALETRRIQLKQARQTYNVGEENLAIVRDKVKNLSVANNRIIEAHQVAMQDKRSSMEERSIKLRVFEQENTPEMVKLNRRLTIAKTIKAESGTDAEMQWNLLDTQERHYRQQIREAVADAGGGPTGRNVQNWRDQIKDIGTSKGALVKTMAADASTIYSKDSPKGIFKDKLQATLQSIPGLKYSDNLAGMIQELTQGQAPFVLAAYQDHAKEMRRIYQNNRHGGIQDQLKIADSNSKLAENMVFKKMWEAPKKIRPAGWKEGDKTIAAPPKNLYLTDDKGKILLDKQDFAIYNPKVRQGDRVIINDPYTVAQRAKRQDNGTGGYTSKEGIYTDRGIIGYRHAGNKGLLPTR